MLVGYIKPKLCLLLLLFFNDNFVDVSVMHNEVSPLKLYSSVVLSLFTESMQSAAISLCNSKTSSSPPKEISPICLSPGPWQLLMCFLTQFCTFHISQIIKYVYLVSKFFHVLCSKFIHIMADISTLFLSYNQIIFPISHFVYLLISW